MNTLNRSELQMSEVIGSDMYKDTYGHRPRFEHGYVTDEEALDMQLEARYGQET